MSDLQLEQEPRQNFITPPAAAKSFGSLRLPALVPSPHLLVYTSSSLLSPILFRYCHLLHRSLKQYLHIYNHR
jgi:hypothetical protein